MIHASWMHAPCIHASHILTHRMHDKVADMEMDKVADKVADMEVDKVADMVADMHCILCMHVQRA